VTTDDRTGAGPAPSIDCHAHVVPVAFLEELERAPAGGCTARLTDSGWVVGVPGAGEVKVPPPMADEARRTTWCAEQGLAGQVLSPWMDVQPTPIMPAADARSLARRLNEQLAELAGSTGATAGALASVAAAHDPDQAADDLVDAVRLGLCGLLLSTNPSETYDLTDRRYDALWAAAEELGVPIMLHPPTDGPSARLTGGGQFGNIYGRLIDTTLTAARLVISGIFDRHPGLELVLVHGGGFLPYQLGRLDGGHPLLGDSAPDLDRGRPSAYLDAFSYDTVALAPEAVRFLVELVGQERVLLGTDYPFTLGGPRPVDLVAGSVAEPGRAAVMGDNATTLFERSSHE
jgi:aminocarboxymuconate-semialdehyde decarboxylase